MKTINATKGEFVNLINGLFQVQNLKGKEFGLIVSKNLTTLEEKLKHLEKEGKPSPEFMELAEKVNKLANTEDEKTAKKKIDELEKENKELVADRRAQMDRVTELMKDKMSIKLSTLSEDLLPDDITALQIGSIKKIIE